MSELPGKGLGGALEIRGAAAVVAGAQIERPGVCSEKSCLCKYKYGWRRVVRCGLDLALQRRRGHRGKVGLQIQIADGRTAVF
jgi:hypothetical protein